MSLSTGDILKIVVTMAFTDGNVIQNVFAMLLSGAGGPWDELDILSDVVDYMDTAYLELTIKIDDIQLRSEGSHGDYTEGRRIIGHGRK